MQPADSDDTFGAAEPPLHRAIWSLAWPAVVTMLLLMANSMMDALFVGHLPNSRAALAAAGVGGSLIYLLVVSSMGVSAGVTALVSRSIGAGNRSDAARAAGQAITLAAISGTLIGLACYVLRFHLAGVLLGGPANVEARRQCVQYLAAALPGALPMFVGAAIIAAFRGAGDTRTPMHIMIVVVAVHLLLSALLIFGLLGFPRLLVRGAGAAFAGSALAEVILYVVALRSRLGIPEAFTWRNLRLTAAWSRRILRIGVPASMRALLGHAAMLVLTGILAHTADGSAGVAALEIGIRAEAVAVMPGAGYRVAAATLAGQNLGAGLPKRAEQAARGAALQSAAFMSMAGVCFFVFAHTLSGLFTSDPAVRHLGAEYLRINAFCQPFMACTMVFAGAMRGAGETLIPSLITIVENWLIQLPLAWFLMFYSGLQARGAWIATCVSAILNGICISLYFRTGRWKHYKV
ncbi:MAG: MATE family efflux transporter [Armatimonadetes bacterium]|nr:MATE family efflux transporter [Armatimonadota bacterium]MDE2207475.1 MATE family efflux transporter [Armatimonadota bacterium]